MVTENWPVSGGITISGIGEAVRVRIPEERR